MNTTNGGLCVVIITGFGFKEVQFNIEIGSSLGWYFFHGIEEMFNHIKRMQLAIPPDNTPYMIESFHLLNLFSR